MQSGFQVPRVIDSHVDGSKNVDKSLFPEAFQFVVVVLFFF